MSFLQARVVQSHVSGPAQCSIIAGPGTTVTFVETDRYKCASEAIKSFEGWHIALYLENYSAVYNKVNELGINLLQHRYSDKAPTLQEALKCSQFRMRDIIAVQDSPADEDIHYPAGSVLYSFGHELRSLYHPRFLSSLMH